MSLVAKNYSVDLDVFQGPLDLLLYLIKKEEVDIYDIPVARVTAQYLKYVEMLKLLNLENAGDYILMAATLIRIKAQMLLPRESMDEDELDPREELTKALLEYRKYKEASEILREKRLDESRMTAVFGHSNGYRSTEAVLQQDTSLFALLTAFHDVMSAFKEDDTYTVKHDDTTVEDRIEHILGLLSEKEFATFEELFADVRVKIIAIMTFLAILEMTKHHRVKIRQAVAFSEIRIYPTDRLHQTITLPPMDITSVGTPQEEREEVASSEQ
ncbi:MAG: segregation/condensation protein A [Candidatus Zixiibacteriota bacterium]